MNEANDAADTQNESEDQPVWAPPESQPEPRPTEPVVEEPVTEPTEPISSPS